MYDKQNSLCHQQAAMTDCRFGSLPVDCCPAALCISTLPTAATAITNHRLAQLQASEGYGDVVERSSTTYKLAARPNVDTTVPSSTDSDDVDAELRQFARHFRLRRMRLGATQADVGRAMAHLRHTATSLSQSTVCRFESMTLSRSNMFALRPGLAAWLAGMEGQGDGLDDFWTQTTDRRRRRTVIASPERRSLEQFFADQPRPSTERMAEIASMLRLSTSAVRVWYCNQRQKQKRLNNTSVADDV